MQSVLTLAMQYAFIARTIQARAASEGRSQGNHRDGKTCRQYAILP